MHIALPASVSWERGRGDLKEEKNETIDFRRDEVLKRLRYERYKRNRDTASNAVRPPPLHASVRREVMAGAGLSGAGFAALRC